MHFFKRFYLFRGAWVAQMVKHLPSAQVMIPGSWDRALHRASCLEGSLLLPHPHPHPLLFRLLVLCRYLCQINKYNL